MSKYDALELKMLTAEEMLRYSTGWTGLRSYLTEERPKVVPINKTVEAKPNLPQPPTKTELKLTKKIAALKAEREYERKQHKCELEELKRGYQRLTDVWLKAASARKNFTIGLFRLLDQLPQPWRVIESLTGWELTIIGSSSYHKRTGINKVSLDLGMERLLISGDSFDYVLPTTNLRLELTSNWDRLCFANDKNYYVFQAQFPDPLTFPYVLK